MKKVFFSILIGLFANSVFAGSCDYSYGTAKDGSQCGKRSSSYKQYGY